MSVFIGSTKVAGGPTVSQQLYSPDKYYNDGDSVIHNGNLWKRSGSGSGVEPGTDYNVWNVGFSNENLLDNPWFTVNQRGASDNTWNQSSYIGVDRWGYSNIVYNINADKSITLPASGYLTQGFEHKLDSDKIYTISVLGEDNRIYAARLTFDRYSEIFYDLAADFEHADNKLYILSQSLPTTIKAIKLELGPISTLANDVAPDYGTELAKCQRYCVVVGGDEAYHQIGIGQAVNNSWLECVVPVSVTMRSMPVITYTGAITARNGATYQTITGVFLDNKSDGCLNLHFDGAFETGRPYSVYCEHNAKIILSADL